MKQTNQKIMLGMVVAVMACSPAHGQSRAQSPPDRSGTTNSSVSESGGYFSGGERGGVVQVISDAEVQSELRLSSEQHQQVNDVLRRVKAMENELFEDLRRSQQERSDSMRARIDDRSKKYQEAHQQLDRATKKILEQLTPAQRTRLQVFCRQAQADEAGFQARMAPGQGYGRGGGGFGAGGGRGGGGGYGGRGGSFTGGGGGGGANFSGAGTGSGTNSRSGSLGGVRPGGAQTPMTSGRGAGGGGSFGGGGGSTSPEPGTTWRSEQRDEYYSGGGPGGVVRVISYERVQDQLGLSGEQRHQIAEVLGQVWQFEAAFQAEVQASRKVAGLGDIEQRKQKEESTRQAVAKAGEEILRLLQPAQQTRLKELCLQAQGAEALFKPEIIQSLGLTATQQIKLANMREEARRQVSALYQRRGAPGQPPPPIDPQSAAERSRAIQRDTEQRMIATGLTSAQQSKLKEMQGKEFAGAARFRSAHGSGASAGATANSSQQLRQP